MKKEEALEQIRKWDFLNEEERTALQTLIPELSESEDEWIRKGIIEIIKAVSGPDCDVYLDEKKQEKYLAWLEKQKEPQYTKRNALFDKCVENCDPEVMKEVSDKVDEMLGKGQKPVEWSEDDEIKLEGVINDLETLKDWIRKHDTGWKNNPGLTLIDKRISWLKSLRPSWKPSEHQMNILKAVKDYVGAGSGYWGEGLGSLIDDLERLM